MAVTLKEYLGERFGVQVTERVNPDSAGVNIGVTQVLRPNPNRLAFAFINLSVNNIYLSIETNVSSTRGIGIGPNGGHMVVTPEEDFSLPSAGWWGVADADASAILVIAMETTPGAQLGVGA